MMKLISQPTAKNTAIWCLLSILILLLSVWLKAGLFSILLALVSAAVLGFVGAILAHPWLGARTCYRVRYHAPDAPDETTLSPVTVARGLGALAGEGKIVTLIWRRKAGKLSLFMEVPTALDEVVRGMLPRLLPQAKVEAVPGLGRLSLPDDGADLYSWPLRVAGKGGIGDPFNFENLMSDTILAGDFELRVHLAQGGTRVLVHGAPGPQADAAGFRAILPRLMCLLSGSVATKATTGLRLVMRQSGRGSVPWPAKLLRRYPFFEPWPYASSQGLSTPFVPAMHFPPTTVGATMLLDSEASSVIPLLDGYTFPEGESSLLLGVSTADGRAIGLPLLDTGQVEEDEKEAVEQRGSASWGQHFLVIGEPHTDRNETITMLIEQVIALGGGLIFIDPHGGGARRIASQLPPHALTRRAWLDMENPSASVRLNLLSVPPLAGKSNPVAAEAGALVCALQDIVPLLGHYLGELGVTGWGGRSMSNIVLDWASVLLIAHHRARLVGITAAREAPVPDLPTLYELLSESDALPLTVAREQAEWASPSAVLAFNLREAGDDGTQAREAVTGILTAIQERLRAAGQAEQRLMSAALRDQLRLSIHHPSLHRMWSALTEAPAQLLQRTPGPVLLARLPTRGVSLSDAAAARLYSSYLICCVVAASLWRQRSGLGSPPVLLALQDDAATRLNAHTLSMLQSHMALLGRTGVGVLAAGAELPASPEGGWLLDNTGTWWIHSVEGATNEAVRRRLSKMGITADLPLSNMPQGVSVVKFPGSSGPIVATAYTGIVQARKIAKQGRCMLKEASNSCARHPEIMQAAADQTTAES